MISRVKSKSSEHAIARVNAESNCVNVKGDKRSKLPKDTRIYPVVHRKGYSTLARHQGL